MTPVAEHANELAVRRHRLRSIDEQGDAVTTLADHTLLSIETLNFRTTNNRLVPGTEVHSIDREQLQQSADVAGIHQTVIGGYGFALF
ncbi:hypothetical protein ONO23_03114 [Micromonospora noduli]|uniref:Uncharacterized protein n=1 Tax=Micromonospora noduli TaxID=709876 RepID=A0A328NBV2_9ACTN|nr:hypothetical protein LAH08_01566 [Micromonospora noduli]RAO07940.1 hypothetical protein LUPAC07_05870 [Micromonospora noduli]RAO25324.1 hypothetical protein MED15_01087 [Micromonospora noduli]RAO32696.1 hypothetical protein ONO23_03114 [Micromonospora noduli]RAO53879.1 hypothetical protein ONO86_01385 [Micromonospora noduli]